MERKQNIITIAAYVLLMVLFFMFGYFVGMTNTKSNSSKAVPHNTYTQSASLPTTIEEKDFYNVKIDGSTLLLTKVNSVGREVIYSVEISESIFPPDDIDELKEGINFSSIYEANAFIENFTS